jgi:signal transduction histidine kinase
VPPSSHPLSWSAVTVSFRVKLLATHAVIALVVGAVTLLVVERLVTRRMEQQLDQRLEAQARAVAQWLERAGHLQQLARRLAGVVDARVTIIDKAGTARGESTAPANMRPGPVLEGITHEISEAREGRVGRATRVSSINGADVRYVAVAAPEERVVRLGVPTGEIEATKDELRAQLLVAAIASLLVALALAAAIAGPLTRRLRDASALARRIGAGDYAAPAPTTANDEIGVLSHSLATAAAELKATEERRREFLATVAHEIRTPVTSIRGYADILARGGADAETTNEFVQTIQRNSVRIGQLVEDLLELEALDAGKGPTLESEPVALAAIATHVRDTLRARATELDATLEISIDRELTARGDEDALERIVLNLVDNALRHGGKGVRVEVSARRDGERVVLTVSDSGSGVPPEHRARIFERFHRGDAHLDRERRGSGLGLAIARELALAMRGSLELQGGSTFVLELPV